MYLCICLCVDVLGSVYHVYLSRSEQTFKDLVLSFQRVGSWIPTQITRLGGNPLYTSCLSST